MSADAYGGYLRIAFFVSAYRSSAQLTRLVHTMRRAEPEAPIVIHDSFDLPLQPDLFASVSDVHVLRTDRRIVWGDMSLESARWEVFRWVRRNLDIDWLVLLSEQDYPIAPLAVLRTRLARGGADAVMFGRRIEALPADGLRIECTRRYLYRYFSFPSLRIEQRLLALPRRIAAILRPQNICGRKPAAAEDLCLPDSSRARGYRPGSGLGPARPRLTRRSHAGSSIAGMPSPARRSSTLPTLSIRTPNSSVTTPAR